MKTKNKFKIIRFFIDLMEETIHTQCLLRSLRDEIRLTKSTPSIMKKTYLSFSEAAAYIDSTENFIKNLTKNRDLDSYQSPYKGYAWVKRTDLDNLIASGRVFSKENQLIEAQSRKTSRKK